MTFSSKIKSKLFFVICIAFAACSGDKDEPQCPNIEYYVQYEVKAMSSKSYSSVFATLTTEKGVVTMEIPRVWTGTFGPIKSLQPMVLNVKCPEGTYYQSSTTTYGRISICRGNQPYILKAEKTISYKPLEMLYTVTLDDLK